MRMHNGEERLPCYSEPKGRFEPDHPHKKFERRKPMQRYKVVVVCCTADETDVHTIRVNGWGESEAEYNARRKIQKFHRHEYEKITVTRIEKIK